VQDRNLVKAVVEQLEREVRVLFTDGIVYSSD
jgi:hypothetical protein